MKKGADSIGEVMHI